MVYRWRCRHCGFTVWSSSHDALAQKVKAHLLDHHSDGVSKVDFRLWWECPHCDAGGQTHDHETGLTEFKDHLYEHHRSQVETEVHVADDLDGSGKVIVKAPLESTGADNARVHFLSLGDIVILVTRNPADRVRLLHESLQSWPAWTVVITTERRPLEGVTDIDFGDVPLEVVKLDQSLGLSGLGETISRVIAEQQTPGQQIVFEFDILPEIIDTFDLKRVFKFLTVLSSRLDGVDAISQFYIDPRPQSATVLNVIDQRFELEVIADGNVFTAREP